MKQYKLILTIFWPMGTSPMLLYAVYGEKFDVEGEGANEKTRTITKALICHRCWYFTGQHRARMVHSKFTIYKNLSVLLVQGGFSSSRVTP